MISKPYLLFLGEAKDDLAIKTASGVRFWRPEWCVGQMLFKDAKAKLDLPEMNIEEAIENGCKTMVIGVVNAGGIMPETWIKTILEAINAGLNIASGMHTRLSSIKEFREAAEKNNIRLHDLRFNEKTFKTGSGIKRKGKRLLTVGTDCSVGKKYTALAIEKAMKENGMKASFKATGQTGILIAENGVAIDAIISDFISGAVEWLSPDNDEDHWDVIEGQGSIFHPSFAGVSLGLLHGSQPDKFIVCHEPTRSNMRGVKNKLPSISEVISKTVELGKLTNPEIQCAGIALNTSNILDKSEDMKKLLSDKHSIPCLDPLKDDLSDIINLINK